MGGAEHGQAFFVRGVAFYEPHIVAQGSREQLRALRNIPNPLSQLARINITQVGPIDGYLARAGRVEAENHFDQGRLARTRWAPQRPPYYPLGFPG